jgi:uncharacterized protein involved in exopolysaccharide biosynthesis
MFEAQATSPAQSAPAAASDGASDERPGFPVDVPRVLGSVRAGWRWIAAAAALSLTVGALGARKFVHREYASELSILWEPASADGAAAAEDEARTLRTLADTVKLPINLATVRERLRVEQTLERMGRHIEVTSSTETRLIVLHGTGESPEDARRITQSTADVFLEHRRGLHRARLDEQLRTIETDAREARTALEASRARYDEFRRAHGIANLPAEQLAAIEHAARLRADADLARAEAEGESAREGALRAAARAQNPLTVLSESEQMFGATRLAETEGQLTVARSRLTGAHPALQALEAQANALRARSDSAVRTGRIIGRNPHWDAYTASAATAGAVGSSLRRREAILRSSLRETASRVDELASLDGESATLLASVTVAERHLAEVLASRARAQDAQRSPATGLRVVAAAVAPDRPSKSLRRPIIAASPVLGALIALMVLLVRGLRGGKAFTGSEVAFWLNAPVLACTDWPAKKGSLGPLVDDVREALTDTNGTTLIVGLNEAGRATARELAAKLSKKGGASQSETKKRSTSGLEVRAWDAAATGPALRRAARGVDRVLVVVESGAHVVTELRTVRERLGGIDAIACVVIGMGASLADRPDRVGSPARFERGQSEP